MIDGRFINSDSHKIEMSGCDVPTGLALCWGLVTGDLPPVIPERWLLPTLPLSH